ncbi:MAG: tRNA glutamyl-Q(34) synthetase GluQRS [Dongiaceae bacterium]
MVVTRFAPSPTGYLHLGHALSALTGWRAARAAGGRFLLRIEDIDAGRCRPDFEAAIYEDLAWLGLDWERPVRRQSEHLADYAAALERLRDLGVVYPCFCTRREIAAEIAAAGRAPHGAEGPVYPGTCRWLSPADRGARIAVGDAYGLRLDAGRAHGLVGTLSWQEQAQGAVAVEPQLLGDVVLARKDAPASYHLAVALDDHVQGVTLVTRGRDLFSATHVHRLLQALLGLAAPAYHHHVLLTNEAGERLAKRDAAASLRSLRAAGAAPAAGRGMAGFSD